MKLMIVAAIVSAFYLGGPAIVSFAGEPASEERFVRYYLPWGHENPRGEWQPESTMPKDPQDASKMVIWEVSRFHDVKGPTPEQRQAQEKLVKACFAAAEKNEWFHFAKGYDSGYRKMFDDNTHFGNEAYALDGVILDPERPEFLMYYDSPMGKQLVGVMFLMNENPGEGPQTGGPDTIWHYHVWEKPFCLAGGLLIIGRPDDEGVCERGMPSYRSPEMVHVWLIDHPDGPFATKMEISPILLPQLLEERYKERGY